MINPELHKKPIALDRVAHRNLKIRRDQSALDATTGLNAFFITAAEFADACKEYPILFLRAGKDEQGKDLCAPVTVFGLLKGENLVYRHGRWNARYVPALLRAYPFAMAPTPDKQFVVCFDETSPVFSQTEGQALFDEKGEATPYLEEVRQFVEKIDQVPVMPRCLPAVLFGRAGAGAGVRARRVDLALAGSLPRGDSRRTAASGGRR